MSRYVFVVTAADCEDDSKSDWVYGVFATAQAAVEHVIKEWSTEPGEPDWYTSDEMEKIFDIRETGEVDFVTVLSAYARVRLWKEVFLESV